VLWIAAAPLFAQEGHLSLGHEDWEGVRLHFSAMFEPPDPVAGKEIDSMLVVGESGGHRLIFDRNQKRYFGYDVRMEPRASGTFLLRIEPLNLTKKQSDGLAVDASWTKLGLPRYPVVPDIRVGDTVTIDLLVNPATGQKIVDYISLKRSIDRSVPQDFSLAEVVLEWNNPSISVNGKPVESSPPGGGTTGSALWFYLPGHGEYVISLVPNPKLGFRKAGQVSDRILTFSDGGVMYRLESSSRIAPGLGVYNVYVRHSASSRPNGTFIFGSADRPEYLIHE